MTTLQLILFLIIFPLSVGIIYGVIARLTARRLKERDWRVRDIEEERFGWEPELIYNLPPDDEWLTLWEAFRKQRRLDRQTG